MPAEVEYIFDVFISYSHQDGRAVARWLQHKIQSYRLPRATVSQKAKDLTREQRSEELEQTDHWIEELERKRKVFRDETDLSVSPNLWDEVRAKLLSSKYLIFVATPQSSSSKWVAREIEEFRSVRPGNVLTVLAAGSGCTLRHVLLPLANSRPA